MSKKILVVDDDTDILNLLKLELTNSGFEPILANSVSSAIKELSQHSFECAVLDIVMGPNETTDEVIKFLKNTSSNILNFDLPLIIISAHITDEMRIRMISKDLLIVDALKKPLKKNQLSKKLQSILASQSEADEELDVIFRPFENEKPKKENLDAEKNVVLVQKEESVIEQQALDEAGISKLMNLCFRGDYQGVQELMFNDLGTNILERSQNGKTCMHYAARGGNLELIDFLLVNGLKINERDKKGKEPLYEAINAGNVEMCKHLIEKKARTNSKFDGKTYLMLASMVDNIQLFELFLHEGVNPTLTDEEGKTVKLYIKTNGQDGFLALLDKFGF